MKVIGLQHFYLKNLLFILSILLKTGLSSYSQPNSINFENFTTENGLSNDQVHNIFQDNKGWMWFGTYHGLNRFDGYKFTVFDKTAEDPSSLGGSIIRCIFEDKEDRIWVGTEKNGVCIFNPGKENFKRLEGKEPGFNLRDQSVNVIKQDSKGNLWLGTDEGLCKTDVSGNILKVYKHSDNDPNSIINNSVKFIFIDRNEKIWAGTKGGVEIIDPQTGHMIHLKDIISDLKDEINVIFCDNDSKIWIGTSKNGIFIVDPLTFKSEHLLIDPANDRSITVRAIIRDQNGYYWIGTRGGLYIYSKEARKFSLFKHDERESQSLIHNSILDLYKDKKGDIWIATRGGISYVVKERQVFQCYRALPNDNHYLNNGEIYAFWMDKQGRFWIGTETGGVNIFDRGSRTFSYIRKEQGHKGLSSNCVKAIMGDKLGNVWVGTFNGGINIINPQSGQTRYFQNSPNDSTSLSNNIVWALYRDSKENMWVGTNEGLDRFDEKAQKFIHYKNVIWGKAVIWIKEDSNHDLWIGGNDELVIYNPSTNLVRRFYEKTRMMHQDLSGRFWVTTLDKGLAIFDKKKGIIKAYDKFRGIANNQTYCILEDGNGYLWISTIDGISRFDPQKEQFKNFDRKDGLQNNQFRYGACFKTPDEELIFGGITGFNIFKPSEIKDNEYEPPIVFTDFKIFNRHVPIGDNKKAILQKSISETREIKLPYDKNVITIEFAALNYAQTSKNKYAYKLKGFEEEWNETGTQRSATYTNLDPGEYTFMVRSSNNDNVWNKNDLELTIRVLPPYWKTWWFKILVVVFIIVLMVSIFKFLVSRNHLKHELAYERERMQMLRDLDMMKVSFFTNVSHELRTPLTLITSPLEKILHSDLPAKEVRAHLLMMNRNAKQLLRLVNQLLDFRKIESGNLKLELSQGDIIQFLREVAASFATLAEEKKIDFTFICPGKEALAFFDTDKLEKIVNNLLSNSVKFTPEGGTVRFTVSFETKENNNEGNLELTVEDTGVGIPASNINRIFDRFFESGNSKEQTGTGIGLALTKELVKIHNGRIFVESIPDQGSKFTVTLPVKLVEGSAESRRENSIQSQEVVVNNGMEQEEQISSEKIMLIVDDNPDVRFFINSHFKRDFKILEANNGKEGLNLAFKYLPDIIISDILMPLVDGKEFCKGLKKDERTSHIPIILLTALSSRIDKMEGMVAGADDYITKPFDIVLLETKVENLLMMRNLLREKYSGQVLLKPKNIIIGDPDEKFLHKVIEAIENNLTDADFDIDKLSQEVGVSRTQMYRKLSVLTDMTVREFIKNIRLKRAAQLLEQNKMNISEIAYAVGFKDLSHFRKSFRQEFGMSASEYAAKNVMK